MRTTSRSIWWMRVHEDWITSYEFINSSRQHLITLFIRIVHRWMPRGNNISSGKQRPHRHSCTTNDIGVASTRTKNPCCPDLLISVTATATVAWARQRIMRWDTFYDIVHFSFIYSIAFIRLQRAITIQAYYKSIPKIWRWAFWNGGESTSAAF